ncbi:MAG TPA: hypothetical protein VGW12_10790 [Pyrinomonadaceae bacterium]|nr:hypothetical protein [Pyrinomonadaceae bacterium]
MNKNASELLFEDYLNSQGLNNYDYEPKIEGKGTRVDYRLWLEDSSLLFEVKEFQQPAAKKGMPSGFHNPYKPVHNKIEAALRNLGPYQGYCCSIVLYNGEVPSVDLTKEFLLGGMLGPVSLLIPFDENGRINDREELTFSEGGYMIDHVEGNPRNTHISAMMVLDDFPIGSYNFDIQYQRRAKELGRRLTRKELFMFIEEQRAKGLDYGETTLRVLICENPYADIQLPRQIFTGPFDERYGPEGDHILRVFAGEAIKGLEAKEVYPRRSPLSAIMKRNRH